MNEIRHIQMTWYVRILEHKSIYNIQDMFPY